MGKPQRRAKGGSLSEKLRDVGKRRAAVGVGVLCRAVPSCLCEGSLCTGLLKVQCSAHCMKGPEGLTLMGGEEGFA